jgi:hypothetical protein
MTTLPQQRSNALMIAEIGFGAPILLAFLIGVSPVLIPVLLYRWLMQPKSHTSLSQQIRPRATRPERRELPERRGLTTA